MREREGTKQFHRIPFSFDYAPVTSGENIYWEQKRETTAIYIYIYKYIARIYNQFVFFLFLSLFCFLFFIFPFYFFSLDAQRKRKNKFSLLHAFQKYNRHKEQKQGQQHIETHERAKQREHNIYAVLPSQLIMLQ